ncbi:MAG: hypothetical protein JST55_03235 [Bacteroidetes bacterium]|nr:hypothetical protein [Bacteroidota bacterium]
MESQENSFSLFDYYKLILEYRNKLLIITGIAALLTTIVVFFVMDPIFFSSGTIKTATKASGIGSLLSSGGIPDIGDLGDLAGVSSGSKELALYENILISRKNIEEAIIKFKLNDEWEYKYLEDAVKNFKTNVLDIKKDKLAGTMEIGIFDKNPQRAKEIAEFMINQLNKINSDLNVLNAKNNREFIQSRFELAKMDLKNSEDSLKIYQDKFGLSPDLLVKAAVQSEIQLEVEIKSEEVKLDLLRRILTPDQPEIKSEEEKLNALRKQLSDINNSNDVNSSLTLKGKPDVVMNFLRLQRNVEIQNKIMSFLLPIFEQSKIEEKKNTPSVLILDYPNLPEKKVKPKRIVTILLISFIAFFFSLIFFIVKRKWNLYKLKIS